MLDTLKPNIEEVIKKKEEGGEGPGYLAYVLGLGVALAGSFAAYKLFRR